jgi:aminopeptidase N
MVMYRRAPVILNRLEQRIGADAFDRFLHRYMVEDVRTTRRLIEHLREIAGEEPAEWFTAELMREPDPEPAENRVDATGAPAQPSG